MSSPADRLEPSLKPRLASLVEDLLHEPERAVRLARDRGVLGATVAWTALALVAVALYGLGAGAYAGGAAHALAALKAPLVVLGSLALCAPSLFVFGTLRGSRLTLGGFAAALAGFASVLSLLLLGLAPVVWLFSASSRSLGFVVLVNVSAWVLALLLARRHLRALLAGAGGTGSAGLWLVLLLVVGLQMTTYVRPVLVRSAGEPVFAGGKMSFIEHVGKALDHE